VFFSKISVFFFYFNLCISLMKYRAAACRPKLIEQFLFLFNTYAEIINDEEKPGFLSSLLLTLLMSVKNIKIAIFSKFNSNFSEQLLHSSGSTQGRQPHYQHMAERKDNGPLPDAVPREDDKLDEMIASRVVRFARSHVFQMQLPETLFQSARVTFNPNTFDVDYTFPAQSETTSRAMAEGKHVNRTRTN